MDKVNPKHYNKYEYQPVDFTRNFVPDYNSYLVGQVVKYLSRHVDKDGVTDLQKALFYLDRVEEFKADYPCDRFINQLGILEGLIILNINSGNIDLAKETLELYIRKYDRFKPISNKMSWVYLCDLKLHVIVDYMDTLDIVGIKGHTYSIIKDRIS